MKEESINLSGTYLKRVNKAVASKEFNKGNDVWLMPSNIRPNNPWIQPCLVSNDMGQSDFNKVINNYTYYNCNSECGTYVKFYIVDIARTNET